MEHTHGVNKIMTRREVRTKASLAIDPCLPFVKEFVLCLLDKKNRARLEGVL